MQHLPLGAVTLIDLSGPMLDRATERIGAAGSVEVRAVQCDIRDAILPPESFDVAVAAATLHHLRGDDEWRRVFAAVGQALKPGGSFWISDLVLHLTPGIEDLMWRRYGEYLAALKGAEYRDHVLAYVTAEDTPRPLAWQLDLLIESGFRAVEVLHKNTCFAAFGGIK
jgi:tRNA (cmo5U34)-methyltransferase